MFQPYGDNFVPVIPTDALEHTPEKPFCWNDACPCREDQDALGELAGFFQQGLVSRSDVDNIYHGRVV